MIQDIILTSRFLTPRWILVIFSSLIILLPIMSAIINQDKLPYALKIIKIYCIGTLFFEILCWSIILLPFSNHQNHWTINLFNIFELLILGYYFFHVIINKQFKNIIKYLTVISVIAILFLTIINFDDVNKYDTITHSVTYLTLMLFVLINFYEILYFNDSLNLGQYPYFWIASGILIYFAGSFFVNLFGNTILFNSSFKDYWLIYYILLIIFRIFLAIGLWFSKTPQQLSPSLK